jgi:hypothetical protein
MLATVYTGTAVPFPYGSASGDVTFAFNDDNSATLTLKESTTIYGSAYTSVSVNNNGEQATQDTTLLLCPVLLLVPSVWNLQHSYQVFGAESDGTPVQVVVEI